MPPATSLLHGGRYCSWLGTAGFGEGDQIEMLVDAEARTLTVKKNGQVLGRPVGAAGAMEMQPVARLSQAGGLCWAVSLAGEGAAVRIESTDPAKFYPELSGGDHEQLMADRTECCIQRSGGKQLRTAHVWTRQSRHRDDDTSSLPVTYKCALCGEETDSTSSHCPPGGVSAEEAQAAEERAAVYGRLVDVGDEGQWSRGMVFERED
jgi:hypothetical protein